MQDEMAQQKETWRPLQEMTDREILEEMAENMRATFDMFNAVSSAVQSEGIMGLAKGLFSSNGK